MKTFIKKFTNEKIEFVKDKNKYFLINKYLINEKNKIKFIPENLGLFLGEEKNSFKPSLALLFLISKKSEQKVFVKDIGELDFIYGKDLRERHIDKTKAEIKKGFFVLIQNENDDNLGYGKIISEKPLKIKNLLDRGDYLRRES